MKTTNSTELPPIPPELAEYIEQAETETLPDPLDDPKVKTLWVPSGRLSFINPAEQNGGQFSLFDATLFPNDGTPLHLHNLESEWFYVVDGNPDLQLDDNLIQGSPGTLKFSPIEELHSIKNNTSEPVRVLLFYQPDPDDPTAIGNIERFFSDPRVAEDFDPNFPDTKPTSFDPADLLAAAPDYGLFNPSTFIFTSQQYTDNEITIVRTGEPDEAANITLSLGDELDIPIYFGEGDMKKTIFLPSSLGEQTQDIILKDPSEGSYVGLTSNQAELSELDGGNGLIVTDIDDDDVLTGGNGDDFLSGLGGNDIIQGFGGRDLILGGSGDDLISGGQDSDTISGLDGDDNISGKDGDDSLNGNNGSDDILAGNGNDTINGGSESDRLLGEDGDDSILGGAAGDRILGGDGNDILAGNGGDDTLIGGSSKEEFSMSTTIDQIFDKDFYLSQYPEVTEAIANGTANSPLDHYLTVGQYQGFLPGKLFNDVYVFGDSFSDDGNLFELTNGIFPEFQNFEGRFTNGVTWIETLTHELGLEINPENNVAYGGATTEIDNILNSRTDVLPDNLLPLPGIQTQIDEFVAENPVVDPDALYVVWGGGNDFDLSLGLTETEFDIPATKLLTRIDQLTDAGAKNIMIPNLFDLSAVPALNGSPELQQRFAQATQDHNATLETALEEVEQNSDVNIIQVDMYSALNQAIENPANFGFSNVTEAFLDTNATNPDEFVFWNPLHPTVRSHNLLANQAQKSLSEVSEVLSIVAATQESRDSNGNDFLTGNGGDNTLIGGSGNDSLSGDSNNDLLIGIDPGSFSSNFGTGELDTLTGGANNDTFVLADENQVFYDDRDNFKAGDEDFALITDFDSHQDTIQLQGEANFYSLDFFTSGAETIDAKVIYDPGVSAAGETIAVLENVDSNLSINDSAFTFV